MGQSGADVDDGGDVHLFMTLAALPLPVSSSNEEVWGGHILWMSRFFVVRCAALWMPRSENHNKTLQTGGNGGGGPAVWAVMGGVISGNAFLSAALCRGYNMLLSGTAGLFLNESDIISGEGETKERTCRQMQNSPPTATLLLSSA